MITAPENTSAPAGVEDPTRAATRVATAASGDGGPLSATYEGADAPRKAARAVTFVTVASGQAHSYELRTGLSPKGTSGGLTALERLLCHDADVSPETNAMLSAIALCAIRQVGTAKHVPRLLAENLLGELDRQHTRIKTLEDTITQLRAELERAQSRSDN